eukprot:TRINITY_DN8194_c0_g1_i2.p1 TRINITY_DN8194_c0_g1~~TRINITY_DN8194_c0_g1_i2.p1  ORF type:complete len:362 (+),score=71.65 TRINITY_DN8194_c0_g1_i2:69-1088(+)
MFTPVHSFLGGTMLFIASSQMMQMNGRVFGLSSIFSGAVWGDRAMWRICVIVGMSIGAHIGALIAPFLGLGEVNYEIPLSGYMIPIAGLLVGLGVQIGSGCTSGHTLCGIARLSPRSIVATCVFFVTAMFTASFLYPQHDLPLNTGTLWPTYDQTAQLIMMVIGSGSALVSVSRLHKCDALPISLTVSLTSLLSGAIFAVGLVITGMANPIKVLSFLNVASPSSWDPSLAMLMMGGLLPNILYYQLITKRSSKPDVEERFYLPTKTTIDLPLILGALLFGVGWGVSGSCPGPSAVLAFVNPTPSSFLFWTFVLLAMGYENILAMIGMKPASHNAHIRSK